MGIELNIEWLTLSKFTPIVSIHIPHDGGIHADSIQKMIWKRWIPKEWQQQKVVVAV